MVSPAIPPGQPVPPPPPPPSGTGERPDQPFILSVLGGVFIALAGAIEIYYGLLASPGPFGGGAGAYIGFGALGSGLGILVIILGALLYSRPEHRVEFGIAITVFSVLSVMSFYGGFIIGLALGVLGGISAIAWRPRPVFVPWNPVPWQVPASRVCLHCGRFLAHDVKFCPYCATPIG